MKKLTKSEEKQLLAKFARLTKFAQQEVLNFMGFLLTKVENEEATNDKKDLELISSRKNDEYISLAKIESELKRKKTKNQKRLKNHQNSENLELLQAAETSLAKDWLKPEEDKAWKKVQDKI